jgi:hypothetical protein
MPDKVNLTSYVPLDGKELLKWILLKSGQSFAEFGEFKPHRSYHNPKVKVEITIETFDATNTFRSGETKVQTQLDKITSSEPLPANTGIRARAEMGSDAFDPNVARKDMDEGRYKTVRKEGFFADVKEKPEQPKSDVKVPQTEEKSNKTEEKTK